MAREPYFPKHEPYPADESGKPMKWLALQINFAEMPELPYFPVSGILQFYVFSDDVCGWILRTNAAKLVFRSNTLSM
ncbi:DUF1963 domain-containing protein [Pseudomonas sp. ISL-88]|nr:DUF1963 domain-containing protein [Pseudomonas sp. ISL-88]